MVEFHDIKAEFFLTSYLHGGEDLEKMKKLFSNLNLNLLESDDEEVEEAEGRRVQMEDLFSPTCEDHIAEDAASAPPPVVIILPDQAEVDKFGALEGAQCKFARTCLSFCRSAHFWSTSTSAEVFLYRADQLL